MSHNEPNSSGEPLSPLAVKIIIGFLVALSAGLSVWAGYSYIRMNTYRSALQDTYLRAADLAADNLSNLSSDLVKGMYTGTSGQLSMVSSRLWKESAAAKSALSSLPISELSLEKTNRFLSQAGDYAMYLSRKSARGEELTAEERQQFSELREYADRLGEQMDSIATSLSDGTLRMDELTAAEEQINQEEPQEVGDLPTLKQVEDSFMGYPTLIYDGPFSDHLLEKTPMMTKGKAEVPVDTARAAAQKACKREIPEMREENSDLPCYVFHDGQSCSVAVTKNGGYLCYLVTAKADELNETLSYEQAVQKAQEYLAANGYSSMKDTYYETDRGVMTINFAYYEPNTQTLCYTDLIKVEVSLQDGSILGFDARGYLVNHQERDLSKPTLTERKAQESLSENLTVENTRLALIPTSGQNEVFVYEFLCSSPTGDKVLCYVNADTGAEEQILILLNTPNGVLTK